MKEAPVPDSLQEAHDELAAQVAALTERVAALESRPAPVSVPPTE